MKFEIIKGLKNTKKMEVRKDEKSMLVRCNDNPLNKNSIMEKFRERNDIYSSKMQERHYIYFNKRENEFRKKFNMLHRSRYNKEQLFRTIFYKRPQKVLNKLK